MASSRTGAWARLIAVVAALAGVVAVAGCGSQAPPRRDSSAGNGSHVIARDVCSSQLAAAGVKGEFAFVRNGGVRIMELPDCSVRLLVAHGGAQPPVGFSADGRYLAFGDGEVIATSGRSTPDRPLGSVSAWAWSPRLDQLAGVTASSGVELWSPGKQPRILLPDGRDAGQLIASQLAFSPGGGLLAITRATRQGQRRVVSDELWLLDLRTGARKLVYHTSGLLTLARFTLDGRGVLFWPDPSGSSSIAADGLTLKNVPASGGRPMTVVKSMLTYPDFIARCGKDLVVTAGAWRETNFGKWLAELSPPAYRPASLDLPHSEAWVDPSCSDHGTIAAAATPNSQNAGFGLEHRSIWLISTHGRQPQRLTNPGTNSRVTDELPRLSPNGRYILFIRGEINSSFVQRGELELITLGTHEQPRLIGPIAQLGSAGGGYYDHYDWSTQTAWYPP